MSIAVVESACRKSEAPSLVPVSHDEARALTACGVSVLYAGGDGDAYYWQILEFGQKDNWEGAQFYIYADGEESHG